MGVETETSYSTKVAYIFIQNYSVTSYFKSRYFTHFNIGAGIYYYENFIMKNFSFYENKIFIKSVYFSTYEFFN